MKTTISKKTALSISPDGTEWCEVTVELRDSGKGPELSITGLAGDVTTAGQAKRDAIHNWESFFEENPGELSAMNERCNTRFRSPRSAARYVISIDGDYHGIDVHRLLSDKQVLVTYSAGQIREEIGRYFPEVLPYFKHHLNGLKANCEHQEARGETYEKQPGATCPDCGWKLGHGWCHRALPESVIAWAKSFGDATAEVAS